MINKEHIRQQVEEHISGTGIFLVDVRLSSTGRLTVLIDRHEGVTIDDCASLSKWINLQLGDKAGDYELNVSSPGLDMPFHVIEQYRKNEGRIVEVEKLNGEKIKGILTSVTDGGFDIQNETKQKGKSPETVVSHFNYDETKAVKVIISFK
jgi:ribosome maturation factor RimP